MLVKLMASPRTSRLWCSVKEKRFTRLRSSVFKPGPRIVPITAIAEGAGRRGVSTGVEPLIAADRRVLLTENCTGNEAVCAAAARSGACRVIRSNGQGETAVQAVDAAKLPLANDGVQRCIHVFAEAAIVAKRQFVNGVRR